MSFKKKFLNIKNRLAEFKKTIFSFGNKNKEINVKKKMSELFDKNVLPIIKKKLGPSISKSKGLNIKEINPFLEKHKGIIIVFKMAAIGIIVLYCIYVMSERCKKIKRKKDKG